MKPHTGILLLFLWIAALCGWLLRFNQVIPTGINFEHFLHTHSHVALLGWLYNACLIFIYHFILPPTDLASGNRQFRVTQLTIVGMLFTFPFQGYALGSILFSTAYIFASYWLVYSLFRQTTHANLLTRLSLRWAGVYLFLSGLGPFLLGYLMNHRETYPNGYSLAIYWFLHFLFNGFFTLVFFSYLAKKLPEPEQQRKALKAFRIFNFSIIPLFALSVLWTDPHPVFYSLALLSGLLQLIAFVYLLPYLGLIKKVPSAIGKHLAYLTITAFTAKLIFQFLGAFSAVQTFINQTVPFTVIGYIHLVMLGFFSLFILAVFIHEKKLIPSLTGKIGIWSFVVGIVLSELLLFGQGMLLYFYQFFITKFYLILLAASALMPIGIGLLTFDYFYINKRRLS